jgi:hypothetical protein
MGWVYSRQEGIYSSGQGDVWRGKSKVSPIVIAVLRGYLMSSVSDRGLKETYGIGTFLVRTGK